MGAGPALLQTLFTIPTARSCPDIIASEVLVLFDQQADSLLKVIRDTESTRMRLEISHRLKGAARGVGAFSVARAAEEIETATDEIELANAVSLLTARVTEARLALAGLIGNA